MNRSIVRFLISKLLLIEAGLLVVPLIVALIYQEDAKVFTSILGTMAILLFIGVLGTLFKPKNYRIYTKEGMLIVALCWVLWSFFGGLPFVFAGQIPSVIDAFFEMSSGFTSTGATILTDTGVLTHSLLFWRSFAHLIGGMGVLVFALAIMNNRKNVHHEVMRAEVPGPVFGKVVAILWICGMPLFDSIVIAMGGAGTGGFAVYNDSIAHYNSDLITYVVTVGTLLFGVNFNLYFYILLRKIRFFFQDEELRTYLTIVAVSTSLIILNIFGIYHSLANSFKYSFFEVSTIITTTGFGLTDITKWPLFSQYILLLLMFIGGSAGSTAGGFKVIRAMIIAKIARNQTLASLYPNRILSLHINGSVLDKETQHSVLKYLAVYVLIILSLVTILSLDNQNFLIVTSAAASTFNNIGPLLGTTDSFAIFSPLSKLIMGFAMIAGRLEIYPLLLLFLPKTWSKI